MSVAHLFLRAGRPASHTLNDLVDRLQPTSDSQSPRYTEWLWVCYFPRQWCYEARFNSTSAPILHALLGREHASAATESEKAWQLLFTYGQPDCYEALAPYTRSQEISKVDLTDADSAAATFSSSSVASSDTLEGTKTWLEVVDRVVRATPTHFLPSRCAFVACVEGRTHEQLGFFSPRRWHSAVEAVRKRCQHRLAARGTSASEGKDSVQHTTVFSDAFLMRDWSVVEALSATFDEDHTTSQTDMSVEEQVKLLLGTPAIQQTLREVLVWVCEAGVKSLPLARDASLPLRPSRASPDAETSTCAESELWCAAYTRLLDATLAVNPLLWTATFCDVDGAAATNASDDALKGLAKLRAQRDAARDEWRERVGRGATFSVPPVVCADATSQERASSSSSPASSSKTCDGLAFRHAVLLQKPPHAISKSSSNTALPPPQAGPNQPPADPILTAAAMEGISLDVDDVRPLPIAAQLHLYPDRGDAAYIESSGLNNSEGTVLDFHLDDYLHQDGELFVQLGPVEGVPFDLLDALIAKCEASYTSQRRRVDQSEDDREARAMTTVELLCAVLHATAEREGQTPLTHRESPHSPHPLEQQQQRLNRVLPPLCEGSRSRFIAPRVVYRKPTGANAKHNPLAKAHAAVQAEAPSPAMLLAAAQALSYLSSHVHSVESSTATTTAATSQPTTHHRLEEDEYAVLPIGKYTLGCVQDAPEGSSVVNNVPCLEAPSTTSSDGEERRCAWCGRARERLLRCGGCRAVHYCCAAHQALDWKSGDHKNTCSLFLHAQTVQQREVVPLLDGAAASDDLHASVGWSYAATLVDFVMHLSTSSKNASPGLSCPIPLCVHVIGVVSSHLDSLLHALGGIFAKMPLQTLSRPPVRVLLCASDLPRERHNQVWASTPPSPDGPTPSQLHLLPETGVLGDVWRQQQQSSKDAGVSDGAQASAYPSLAVRFVGAKYHAWYEQAGAMALPRAAAPPPQPPLPLAYAAPDAVLLFAPLDGTGLSYLTAAGTTIADHLLYRCPVRVVDSSFVGSVRTGNVLAAHGVNSAACIGRTRVCECVEKDRHVVPVAVLDETTAVTTTKKPKTIALVWDVKINRYGFGPSAAQQAAQVKDKEAHAAATSDAESLAQARSRVPSALIVANAFYFDVNSEE